MNFRIFTLLNLFCYCSSITFAQPITGTLGQNTNTRTQLIRLVGIPDQLLQLRITKLTNTIDTFHLRTEGAPIISVDDISTKLLTKDRNYFYEIKDKFGMFLDNIKYDTLLITFFPSTQLSSQLDSLIDYATKGFEWPQDCQHFDLSESFYRQRTTFFHCCNYFRWYAHFRNIESFIEHLQPIPADENQLIQHTLPGTGPSNLDYYCSTVTEMLTYDKIISELQSFKLRWETLTAHFSRRQAIETILLQQRSKSYHQFHDRLKVELTNMRDSILQYLTTAQQQLKTKTDSIVTLENQIKDISAHIKRDSETIKKNDDKITVGYKAQRDMDDQYDRLRHAQDSLIAAANNGISTVLFNNIDNSVNQEQYNRIRQTNAKVKEIAKKIAELRQKRQSNRSNMLQLREQNLALLEAIIVKRETLANVSVEASAKKEEFFSFQVRYRASAIPIENFLKFLNDISALYFPQGRLIPQIEDIIKNIRTYERSPFNPQTPDPLYFRNLQDVWNDSKQIQNRQ